MLYEDNFANLNQLLELNKQSEEQTLVEAIEEEVYPVISGKIVNPLEADFNEKLRTLEACCVDAKVFDIQLSEIKSQAVDAKELQQS